MRNARASSVLTDPSSRRTSQRRGLTLLEVMIALAIIAISLLALITAILASMRLQEINRERALAYNAARAQVELMRSKTFSQIYALYNSTTTANTFAVAGLNAIPGTPVGRIVFPELGAPPALREDYSDSMMGMPRDLNGNGFIDYGTSVSTTYKILPVKIVIQWLSVDGSRSRYELNELITSE